MPIKGRTANDKPKIARNNQTNTAVARSGIRHLGANRAGPRCLSAYRTRPRYLAANRTRPRYLVAKLVKQRKLADNRERPRYLDVPHAGYGILRPTARGNSISALPTPGFCILRAFVVEVPCRRQLGHLGAKPRQVAVPQRRPVQAVVPP